MLLHFIWTVFPSRPDQIFEILCMDNLSSNFDFSLIQMRSLFFKGVIVMPFMPSELYRAINRLTSAELFNISSFLVDFTHNNKMPFNKTSNLYNPVSHLVICKHSGYLEQFCTALMQTLGNKNNDPNLNMTPKQITPVRINQRLPLIAQQPQKTSMLLK